MINWNWNYKGDNGTRKRD